MLRRIVLLVLFVICSTALVSAQAVSPAYQMTSTPPVADMLALNQLFTMYLWDNTINPPGKRAYSVVVEAYIIWLQPVRPPEYSIRIDGIYWAILNRETIDSQRNP